MLQIILLQLPFGDSSLAYTPANWFVELTSNNIRPQLPVGMDPQLRGSIQSMWATDPAERPAVQDVLDLFELLLREVLEDARGDNLRGTRARGAASSPGGDSDSISCDSSTVLSTM